MKKLISSLNFKWLYYLRLTEFKITLAVFGILLMVSSLIGYEIPQAISKLYENYSNQELFNEGIKNLLLLFVSQYGVRFVYQILLSNYVKQLLASLRGDLFKNWIYSHDMVHTKEQTFVSQEKYTRGEFQARLMNDTEAIRELITTGSLTIFIDFFFVISCMISFFQIHRFYGVSLIIAEVLVCFFLIRISKFMRQVYAKVRKSSGNLSRVLSSLSNGIQQLYYSRHENYPLKISVPKFDDFLKIQLRANLWDASYYSLAESLFPVLLALVIIVFPYSEVTSVAILAALIDLIQRSIGPIKDIAGKISNIQRAMTGVARITELDQDLQETKVETSENNKESIDHFEFAVDDFLYPNSTGDLFSLTDINVSLEKGTSLGVVGRSGCGKSTLLKLLSGQIFSDQLEVSFLSQGKKGSYKPSEVSEVSTLRKSICLISQDSYLFSNTLLFNITLEENPDRERFDTFWEQTAKEIPYLKKWNFTPDDEVNPLSMSQGQKQLISALRFCYHRKPIALFDEISSALDGELEDALSQFISYIEKDVMMIIVAHRLETLIRCESILFLEKGKQLALGSHENLYQNFPAYQNFFAELKGSDMLLEN